MTDLVVAGAGMAGLVAAAEARRLGAAPEVFEKLDRPGGSMRLSSGVFWRHRDFDRFRAECPGGDEHVEALAEHLFLTEQDLCQPEANDTPTRPPERLSRSICP